MRGIKLAKRISWYMWGVAAALAVVAVNAHACSPEDSGIFTMGATALGFAFAFYLFIWAIYFAIPALVLGLCVYGGYMLYLDFAEPDADQRKLKRQGLARKLRISLSIGSLILLFVTVAYLSV